MVQEVMRAAMSAAELGAKRTQPVDAGASVDAEDAEDADEASLAAEMQEVDHQWVAHRGRHAGDGLFSAVCL